MFPTTPARRSSRQPAGGGSLRDHPTLQLLVGACRLSADWVRQAIDRIGSQPEHASPSARPAAAAPAAPATGIARRALVGAIASLPAWRGAALESAPARLARRLGAAVGETRPGRAAAARLAAARGRVRYALALLVFRGEEEERRGREVARAAIDQTFKATCEQLAASEAIRRLVREQTTGLTESAIAELRAWCAHGDDALEAAVARVLHPFRRKRSPRRGLLPAEAAE